jgi:siroheme synthase
VTIVQGQGPIDFEALARAPGTLVLFMALGRLAEIADGLLEHGLDPNTAAAVIASGTTSAQEVVAAPLERIAEAATDLRPPALVVVGDVVALSERIGAARGTLAAA